jgi:hypothetical protein
VLYKFGQDGVYAVVELKRQRNRSKTQRMKTTIKSLVILGGRLFIGGAVDAGRLPDSWCARILNPSG